jgi:hypothetical protein
MHVEASSAHLALCLSMLLHALLFLLLLSGC